MTPNDQLKSLEADVHRLFPTIPVISKEDPIACATGDDYSVQNIVDILRHRPWDEVSLQDCLECGADELRSYLSAPALAYYLPAFVVRSLESLALNSRTRLNDVVTQLLLPTRPEFRDVWEYFGDGIFDRWGTPFFVDSSKRLIERLDFVRRGLTAAQRGCVAEFIEISETHGVEDSDPEFSKLLKQFANYWRTA